MKALVCEKYGSSKNLKIKDVPRPFPKKNEVLIKIKASAVNDYDWSMISGKPYLYRLLFGLFSPKHSIPGMELSGIVEEAGSEVDLFQPGEEVYGDISEYGFGSMAEYVCIDQRAVVKKPDFISFEEAASISHASMLALHAIRGMGQLRENQKILINGAGGGVGTFGLQIAKQYHAEVTGVDTGEKLKVMAALGFDHVLDYKKVDFTKNGEKYDLIVDAKTTRSVFAYARALKPRGKYITVGGRITRLLETFALGAVVGKVTKKSFKIVALKSNQDLGYIQDLIKKGEIQCIIDGPFPLDKVPEALAYFGAGKHKGKVIISM